MTDSNNLSRRRFIQGSLASASLLGLSGCAFLDLWRFNENSFTLTCDGIAPVVDMHGHFFNASDLNFASYLTGPVLNDIVTLDPPVAKVIQAIGNLLQVVGNNVACSAEAELFWLRNLPTNMSLFSLTDEKAEKAFNEENMTVATELYTLLNNKYPELQTALVDALRELQDARLQEAINQRIGINATQLRQRYASQFVTFDQTTFLDIANNPDISSTPQKGIDAEDEIIIQTKQEAAGYIELVIAALSPRTSNIRRYLLKYSKNNGPSVRNVTAVMCDFDYWLGRPAHRSSIRSQIRLFTRIQKLTQGFVTPVLGVNPYKIAAEQQGVGKYRGYTQLITETLANGVFKGTKLYPNIGYAVDGQDCEFDANPYDIETVHIKTALNTLYEINYTYNCFITSHAMASKGVSANTLDYSSPKRWENVLSSFKDQGKSLNVNFGHMGDGIRNTTAMQEYAQLMIDYDNVYGDVGYMPELSKLDNARAFIQDLKALKDDKVFARTMFGSDWYMILQERDSQNYLIDIYHTFKTLSEKEGLLDATQLHNMFAGNAKRLTQIAGYCLS